jgi:hypothetical protein
MGLNGTILFITWWQESNEYFKLKWQEAFSHLNIRGYEM